MVFLVLAAFSEMQNALVADVGELMKAAAAGFLESIQDDALPQSKSGNHHLLNLHFLEGLLQNDCATQNDVGSLRIEAFDLLTFLYCVSLGQHLHHLTQLGP